MAKALKITQMQEPITCGKSTMTFPGMISVFDIDGSVYMTSPLWNKLTSTQEFWLFKFKSTKLGFTKYQNLITNEQEFVRPLIPQDFAKSTTIIKMGKFSNLLTPYRSLVPFKQSSDPILKRAGKQFTRSDTMALPGFIDANCTGISSTVQYIKIGSDEYFLIPYETSTTLHKYDKKTETFSLAQKLHTDIVSNVDNYATIFSFINENVPGMTDYIPAQNSTKIFDAWYTVHLLDAKTDKYILIPTIGAEQFKDSSTGGMFQGKYSAMHLWKYVAKEKKFLKHPFTKITEYTGYEYEANTQTRVVISRSVTYIKKNILLITLEASKETGNQNKWHYGIYATVLNPNAKAKNKTTPIQYEVGRSLILDLTDKPSTGYRMSIVHSGQQHQQPCFDPMTVLNIKGKIYLYLTYSKLAKPDISYELEVYSIDTKNPLTQLVTPALTKSFKTKFLWNMWHEQEAENKTNLFSIFSYNSLGYGGTVFLAKGNVYYVALDEDNIVPFLIK